MKKEVIFLTTFLKQHTLREHCCRMGKKGKGDKERKSKSGRHVGDDDSDEDVQTTTIEVEDKKESKKKNKEAIIRNEHEGSADVSSAIDDQTEIFLVALENLSNKKAATRLQALNNVVSCLQSGVDLVERVRANMTLLVDTMTHFLTHRTSPLETLSALKVINLLALVVGAGNEPFVGNFAAHLVELATRSELKDVDVRVSAVRTLAFIHLVCCDSHRGYSCFDVVVDIALSQSDGSDVCPTLQVLDPYLLVICSCK